ncbi:hypothetical protein PAMP_001010 [Pampus punctatissimus]
MAHVHSPRVEALVQHCPCTKENDDSDVEFVCETGTQLGYNPLRAMVTGILRERLEVQLVGMSDIDPLPLGPPCKTADKDDDGNCFFKAVSKVFCGNEEYHLTLRQAVVKQLESYTATYKSILRTEYESVPEYIRKSCMQCPGTWATEVEIQAAADVLGVSIYTYYLSRIKYSCNTGVGRGDIYLENCGYHYKTFLCMKDPYTQSCYKYCKLDLIRSGVTRQFTFTPREHGPQVRRGSR